MTVKDYNNDLEIVPPIDSFLYAISLVNGVRVMIDVHQTKFVQQIYRCIQLADKIISQRTTFIDIVYKLMDKTGKTT